MQSVFQFKINAKISQFFLAFSINVALMLMTHFFLGTTFETNDDTRMMLELAGCFREDNAIPHVVFKNMVFTLPIYYLYQINLAIPWYGLSQAMLLILSMSVIAYTLMRMLNTKLALAVYVFFFILIGFKAFASYQFTIIASLLALSGYLLLFLDLREKNSPIISYEKTFSLFLLILSIAERKESIILVSILCLPILGLLALKNKKLPNLAFFLVMIMIGHFLLSYTHKSLVTKYDKQFSFDHYYNSAILVDHLQLEKVTKNKRDSILNLIHWTENDYQLFMAWFYPVESNIYTTANFNKIVENSGINILNLTYLSEVLRGIDKEKLFKKNFSLLYHLQNNGFKDFLYKLYYAYDYSYFTLNTFVFLFCIFIFWGFKNNLSILAILQGIYTLSFTTFLTAVTKEMPDRIWYPVDVIISVICLVVLIYNAKEIKIKSIFVLGSIFLIGLLSTWRIHSTLAVLRVNKIEFQQYVAANETSIAEIKALKKSAVFLCNGMNDYDHITPFSNLEIYKKKYLKAFDLYAVRGYSQSKETDDFIVKSMTEGGAALIITEKSIPLLLLFFKEHYNIDLGVDILIRKQKFVVVQLKKQANAQIDVSE